MEISIVIPTFNRSVQLLQVLDHLLASDTDLFNVIEIIVVDDGSTVPAKDAVSSIQAPEPFEVKYLYQANAGPAAARNHGFRAAQFDLVLFLDDDILVEPSLLTAHYETHKKFPGSVVFGRCPFLPPMHESASYRFQNSLIEIETGGVVRVEVVASGNLSVEKQQFKGHGVYGDDLLTPASEEFELEHRLSCLGIPIYFTHDAVGLHLQPTSIEEKCKQEFKYGVGAAEVCQKIPGIRNHKHVDGIANQNDLVDWKKDGFRLITKKTGKLILASQMGRRILLTVTKAAEKVRLPDSLLFRLYRILCGLYLFAGFRDGLRRFSNKTSQ